MPTVCLSLSVFVGLAQLGNHDKLRISDRFGPEAVDAMNMLLLTLPGIAITYNVRICQKVLKYDIDNPHNRFRPCNAFGRRAKRLA